MATAKSDCDTDDEIMEAALRKLEEVSKPLKNPNTPVEKKREKLDQLSREGLIEKTPAFIKKANKKVIEKLYSEYESERFGKASDFMTGLIISKLASVLGGLDPVESAEELSDELLADGLLRSDVNTLTRMISPLKHDLSCEKEKSNRLQSNLTLLVREINIEVDELNETIASLQGKISTVEKINDQLRASNMCINLETANNIKPNHIDEKSVSFNYNS
jgi:hypothetical protein